MIAVLASLALMQCREDETDGDADVDGDGDVDSDGDADGDGEMPCYPPLGVCDPIFRCGCGQGMYCDVTFIAEGGETAEVCLDETGGTGVHGDEGCSPGTCAPGYFCAGEADPDGNPRSVCRRWCLDDDECTEYPGSHCTNEICYVDQDDNPLGCIAPYKLCTPEDVGLGAGTASFEVCTGRSDNCPGNPPFPYEITGGSVNGRCSFIGSGPVSLTFNLRDEGQSLSVTANEILFDPSDGRFVTGEGSERARFSIIIGDRTFSTTNITSPAETDACELRIKYLEDVAGFDLEFTCNHIDVTRTGEILVTIADGEMGPGTIQMEGCLVE
jgi:hypothetical protein